MKYHSKVYARACLKFYLNNQTRCNFQTEASKLDWEAAQKVIQLLDADQKNTLKDFYAQSPSNFQGDSWALINRVEKDVALIRGIA